MEYILIACGLVITMTIYMLVYTVSMLIIDRKFLSIMSGKKILVMDKVYVTPYKSSVGFTTHLSSIAKEWGIDNTTEVKFEDVVVDNHIVTVHK